MMKNNKGQSAVEYIMLLAVVGVLGVSIFQNDRFRKFFGSDSEFFSEMRYRIEYSYRHGREGKSSDDTSSYANFHELFYNKDDGISRFFSGDSEYPEN